MVLLKCFIESHKMGFFLQVQPDGPLAKAQLLVLKVLKDVNACRLLGFLHTCSINRKHVYASAKPITSFAFTPDLRDQAFKLRPLSLSTDLISQLKACAVKLQHHADLLQSKIAKKMNKRKHYHDLNEQVVQSVRI